MKTIEIKHRYTCEVLFTHSCENNTIETTLLEALKIGADLSDAYLSGAYLIDANLSGANLSGADLSSANLRFNTCLFSAKTDNKIIQLGGIGSSNRATTYDINNDLVFCGCFKGSLEEFKDAINKTHKDNPVYLAEYLAAVEYMKKIRDIHNKDYLIKK